MPDSTRSDETPSKFGKFIQAYSSFLSTFVIGAAGLVATSIWQYRQSEIAQKQAESQQKIAITQAENTWRIERAEILAKNLGVLSAAGPETVEQRYGALLSLTRGNILDPELAVSYALELGKDNAEYMKSVLVSTQDKSYPRLANAYELSCQARFGITRDVAVCPPPGHVERSNAIAELFADEMNDARHKGDKGPIELLEDERYVQSAPLKLATLFAPYLTDLFERRQMAEIKHFEEAGVGARLISALVLGPTQPNSFVAASESVEIDKFHDQRTDWLKGYVFGQSCTGECKGKLVDIMLTQYVEAEGRFDQPLRELFVRPRGEVAMALARLHSRLLQCQVSSEDGDGFRDNIIIPALADALARGNSGEAVDDLLGLIALTQDPSFQPDQVQKRAVWERALAGARDKMGVQYARAFTERRASAQDTRKNIPAKYKKTMFCTADEVELSDVAIDE
ncbi:MAG TPA: hypothetical protein VFZ61_02590 [Polyangiales bacterium]